MTNKYDTFNKYCIKLVIKLTESVSCTLTYLPLQLCKLLISKQHFLMDLRSSAKMIVIVKLYCITVLRSCQGIIVPPAEKCMFLQNLTPPAITVHDKFMIYDDLGIHF